MLRVTLAKAQPGMVLAMPVLHPKNPEHVLLKPGATLDVATIGALGEFRIGALWIKYPPLEHLARFVSPRILNEHARLTGLLAQGFDAVSCDSRAPLAYDQYGSAIRRLLGAFIDIPSAALFVQSMATDDRPLLSHSSNVCFLSLLMGLKLEGYLVTQRSRVNPHRAMRIENLGLGAMLHDTGMLQLAPNVLAKFHEDGNVDDADVRRHVVLGFELLRGGIPATAAGVALHHHQNYDGSGYPRIRGADGQSHPLAGERIHIFSRIVAVADRFDRLRRTRPGAEVPDLPNVAALRAMLDLARDAKIDPMVFRALLSVAPAYPPGSIVGLSDGRRAVVDRYDPIDPCRPVCRVLASAGARLDEAKLGNEVNLRQETIVSIVSIDGVDVGSCNFYPRHPTEFRMAAAPGLIETDDDSMVSEAA
jgi:HD-GYP domain-containing protein (c-di-GMP phosphodiesterase class II)